MLAVRNPKRLLLLVDGPQRAFLDRNAQGCETVGTKRPPRSIAVAHIEYRNVGKVTGEQWLHECSEILRKRLGRHGSNRAAELQKLFVTFLPYRLRLLELNL